MNTDMPVDCGVGYCCWTCMGLNPPIYIQPGLSLNFVPSLSESHEITKNRNIFIAIGCSLLLLMFVAIALIFYVKERNRNNTYRRFFLANNNYTVWLEKVIILSICCIRLKFIWTEKIPYIFAWEHHYYWLSTLIIMNNNSSSSPSSVQELNDR